MEWIKIEDIGLQEDMPCIVKRGGNSIEMLCWNSHYGVWDGADGDDYFCDKEEVSFYIPFSEFPDLPKG